MFLSSFRARLASLFVSIALLAASSLCSAAEEKIVKGEVVSVDLKSNTAVIHPKEGSDAFTVKLSPTVVVAGLSSSARELRKGHLVTLKFAAQ